MKIHWPDNKRFAFTIFDDTDVATLGNIKPIYELLASLGLRTTKTVWPLSSDDINSDFFGSQTLEDPAYCEYIKSLQNRGFEIAYHGARMESSDREVVKKSLEKFRDKLGDYPSSYACHADNIENLYWGEDRFSFAPFKLLFRFLNSSKTGCFYGHMPGSRFYWGDIAKKHIRYARSFSFDEINLFNITRRICYTDPKKPLLNYFFISSDADNVEAFNHLLRLENQKKLDMEGGVCILSTHFGKGFVKNDVVHPVAQRLLEHLSQKDGWFPSVFQLLDFLCSMEGYKGDITSSELFKIEARWFWHSLKRKINAHPYEKSELAYLFPNGK